MYVVFVGDGTVLRILRCWVDLSCALHMGVREFWTEDNSHVSFREISTSTFLGRRACNAHPR